MTCRVPHALVAQHRIEDRQELAHAGDDGHLLGMAFFPRATSMERDTSLAVPDEEFNKRCEFGA